MNKLAKYQAILFFLGMIYSQESVSLEDYQRAESFLSSNTSALVFHANVSPNWLDDGRMWYRNKIVNGAEFIIIDPVEKTRKVAFDHQRIADAISNKDTTYDAFGLPFRSFKYINNGRSISFNVENITYTCNLENYRCTSEHNEGVDQMDNSPRARYLRERTRVLSPDGKLAAFIRDHNLWSRDVISNKERQLTFDGIESYGYATNNAGWTKGPGPVVLWSPDSKKIATFQHDSRGVGEMYMVSTKSGHPELSKWKYPLPGDSLIFRISRVIINVQTGGEELTTLPEIIRLKMPPDQHRSTSDDHIAGRGGVFLDVRWSEDAKNLAFVSSSRDHKEAQLRVANTTTGEVRDIMKEVQKKRGRKLNKNNF